MANHSIEFHNDVIDMILKHGIAIEDALNRKNYIDFWNALHDFLLAIRNLKPMAEAAISAEEAGDDFELICKSEALEGIEDPPDMIPDDYDESEDDSDLPLLQQWSRLHKPQNHGPH